MTAVAALARGGSSLAYPDRFYAAASYVGFGGSPTSAAKGIASKFSNDAALLLYGLYQQVFSSARFGLLLVALPHAALVFQLIDAISIDPLVFVVAFGIVACFLGNCPRMITVSC